MVRCEDASALITRASASFACFAVTEISHQTVWNPRTTRDIRASFHDPSRGVECTAVHSRKVSMLSLDRFRQVRALKVPK